MTFRFATFKDCPLLGELNHQLIEDEGHRNRMGALELQARMEQWISTEYQAVIFEAENGVVAYALFREEPQEVYLRQLFVVRNERRKGVGRAAMKILMEEVWPREKRLTVEVLVKNEAAVKFWRAVGYRDYALTLEVMPDARQRVPTGK